MDSRWQEHAPRYGQVTYYDEKANFGFIRPDDGSADVSFAIRPYDDPVAVGDYVRYELQPTLQVTGGGKHAIHVRRAIADAFV
ncbi:MAG: cold shock domain-containing protein [Thermomicrobiales bacterium]|jgi:cold shock CspA family protein|nr:cold shock domain-containing protein [Thermomicrobiales bacterium]